MDGPCLKRQAGLGFSRVGCHGWYYEQGSANVSVQGKPGRPAAEARSVSELAG